MRYLLLVLFAVALYSCVSKPKISRSYYTGMNRFKFDTLKKAFSFVTKGELSFYEYSEGNYFDARTYLVLHSYSKDSCIKYKILPGTVQGHIQLKCKNPDERVPVIYYLNNKRITYSDIERIQQLKTRPV